MEDDRFATGSDVWTHVPDVSTFRGVPESSRHAEAIARATRVEGLHAYEIPYKKRYGVRNFLLSPRFTIPLIFTCLVVGGVIAAKLVTVWGWHL